MGERTGAVKGRGVERGEAEGVGEGGGAGRECWARFVVGRVTGTEEVGDRRAKVPFTPSAAAVIWPLNDLNSLQQMRKSNKELETTSAQCVALTASFPLP